MILWQLKPLAQSDESGRTNSPPVIYSLESVTSGARPSALSPHLARTRVLVHVREATFGAGGGRTNAVSSKSQLGSDSSFWHVFFV